MDEIFKMQNVKHVRKRVKEKETNLYKLTKGNISKQMGNSKK